MSGNPKGYANPQLLVAPDQLAAQLERESRLVRDPARRTLLLDLRPVDEYVTSHIPGAVHLDLFGLSLSDTSPAPLRAFLWMIEHLLGLRGVSMERPVVVYDDRSGMRAARAFWFLEYFGHPDVRLLDGGFRAWERAGLPASQAPVSPMGSHWSGRRRAERLATWMDVSDHLGDPDTVMLDTRSDGEYHGTVVRAARGGAIPGAVHVEWTRNLDESGAFKPASELRAMYEAAGVTPDREVIAYCQGAYRAAHSYLALRLLGYPRVRPYLGSWKEWGDRVDLPIEQRATESH
jgi:thiosulfate/3-mercaptopyruvate sulfurtransferase